MVASRRIAEVDLWSFGGKLPIWVAEAEMDDNRILELCDPGGA
jgi:hypothetical protein